MSKRLAALAAVVVAASLVAASPATAAAITRPKVVGALLTAGEIGAGWQRYEDTGEDADVVGCESTRYQTVGARFKAERMFQYRQAPSLISESVQSFYTRDGARRDFTRGIKLFSACSSFTIDGQTFRITRLSVPDLADQEVAFQLSGSVATAAGPVELTIFLVAARHGRQTVAVLTFSGGPLTAADRRAVKQGSIRVARGATAKVASVLGR